MIRSIVRYTLQEALHNRIVVLLGLLLAATFLLAEFVGSVALTEHAAIQAATSGALLRVGAVLLVALFVVTTLLREQQDRTLDLVLALEAPRGRYVLGKLLAYLVLAMVVAATCALLVALYAPPVPALRWGLSLACELSLVAALGLLLSFSIGQPMAALAALGAFYLLARSMHALLLIAGEPVFARDGIAQVLIDGSLQVLAWLLPALHRFTDAGWIAYDTGGWGDLAVVATQTAVYLPLLAAAATFDLYRRDF